MLTHILVSLIGATGILLISLSLAWREKPSGLERIEALAAQPDPLLDEYPSGIAGTMRILREKGLAAALDQAEMPVAASRFIRVGILLSAAGFMLSLVATGAIGVSLLAVFIALTLYVHWLIGKRELHCLEYEEALGDMCERLGVGAQLHGSLNGALAHAAETAPGILKRDFEMVSSQVSSGASIRGAFEALRKKRGSYALDLLVDTLGVWSSRGGTLPLHQILSPLSSTIREVAAERRRMAAELSGPRDQMRIVAIAPLILVGLMRLSSPQLARIYASLSGQVIQAVAYLIALGGYLLGSKVLSGVNQVIEMEPA
jgi:Flp pilus assembly protein TadB